MKKWLLISAVVSFCSCAYDKSMPSIPLPSIFVNTPSESQHFVNGDTIRITGTVTHTAPLNAVAVHLTDHTTNNEFFHNHFLADNKLVYNFSSEYIVPNNIHTSFKVEVEAEDIDGNESSKDMIITIN